MGLAYASSDRGGCHLSAFPVKTELLSSNQRIDPLSSEFKAELVKNEQDWFTVIDSLGICLFAIFALGPNQITDLLYTLTGQNNFSSAQKLIKIGERINNLTRLFNLREGITAADDNLPPRLIKEALKEGHSKGHTVPLAEMLAEYYLIRGWDRQGRPTPEKLQELELKANE
jgi:aldehyde:ferredoxin oxidoreductase